MARPARTWERTVVALFGIRHKVIGWTADERGRHVDLSACGRQILTTWQESDDTVNCAECFPE